jgi:pantoate--beta-alanine ligase
MTTPATALDVEQLRLKVSRWRAEGCRTALVPTMGALHDGHLHLVQHGLRHADRVVVSIFVNPRQFAPGEDLDKYPRDEQGDLAKLATAGAHCAYIPHPRAIYPDEFATTVAVTGPAKAGLEDRYRPHFFDGVATIVAKLFIQAGCDYAVFGEKDYQQLKVVARMAADLDIPTTVLGVETVREPDGLAMSSRNAYLSSEERLIAPRLHENLQRLADAIRNGKDPSYAATLARRRLNRAGFRMDYICARNANSLHQLASPAEPIRLLAAGWLGKTRLIDNIAV